MLCLMLSFFVSYQSYESKYQDNEEHASVLFGLGL